MRQPAALGQRLPSQGGVARTGGAAYGSEMKIFGICGWSGSGKTTLVVRLIPRLTALGLRVGTIKHSHHDVTVGDTEVRALAAAGAAEVLTAGPERFLLVHEHHGQGEPALAELCRSVSGLDLLLVEGFKFSAHHKLEVWDPALGKPMLAAADPSIVALAMPRIDGGLALPVLPRDDVEAISGWITNFLGFIGGRRTGN
jgi:molybdopterin-guanine dinucleotide biosynthesis protein B